jgi:cholesterol oxidase
MATQEHVDCIVVGSGFGGSVTAQRMAEAGRSVLVLERGKAYPPGSFARSPIGFSTNFWDPSEGLQGLFDLWSFSGLDALVSSGLGGGSLIYANVLLRKDEHWFVSPADPGPGGEAWPITRADLEPHYDRAEAMLGAQRYPLEHEPYAQTPKTLAFKAAAEQRGLEWFRPPLAVTFANEGAPPVPGEPINEARPNLHGRTRTTCRLCGECDIGCNYGAKNTLDYTYLTAAWHAGATIRTQCEVREFEPDPRGGWLVHFIEHTAENEGSPTDTRSLPRTTVHTDHLVLSAGTLGTTYLLLRNRGALPGLSPRLGAGFTGNGDLLSFAVRCTQTGMDGRRVPRRIDPAFGPVITSTARVPDALDGSGAGRGLYVQDAGYPEFVSWMLQVLDTPQALAIALPVLAELASKVLRHGNANLSAEISEVLGECRLSSGALPLLVMGRDVPDGRMSIAGDRLEVDWRKDGASKDYFDRARQTARGLADELGGSFMDNPMWLLSRVITVHPLGGARMGGTDEEGVVDPYGRVFNHPGLHVADGSVMPGPVGPNPSLTIAALADRFADAMIEGAPEPQRRRVRTGGSANGAPEAAAPPAGERATSLSFTEEMKGFLDFEERDYERAFALGEAARRRLMFHLTITADDIDRFMADPRREARVEGWVECDALGGRSAVEGGHFNLFVDQPDGGRPHKRMYYRLFFRDGAQHPLTMVGFKEVRDDPGLDVWTDTSTLYTRMLGGHVGAAGDPDAPLIATGILHILPRDFARQMTTFRVRPAHRVDALARFGRLFASELWETYRRPAERPGARS